MNWAVFLSILGLVASIGLAVYADKHSWKSAAPLSYLMGGVAMGFTLIIFATYGK